MKMKSEMLREMIRQEFKTVLEAAKKKKNDEDLCPEDLPPSYSTDAKLDHSKPLGDDNLYKRQGRANFGPYTEEKALRLCLRQIIREVVRGRI